MNRSPCGALAEPDGRNVLSNLLKSAPIAMLSLLFLVGPILAELPAPDMTRKLLDIALHSDNDRIKQAIRTLNELDALKKLSAEAPGS